MVSPTPAQFSNRYLTFSQTYKVDNNGINANFVFPYICSFLHYLHHEMSANVKLEINWCKRITFQGYRFHWSCYFLMAQSKRSWQYYAFLWGDHENL